jgi:hypothetical protein
VDGSDLAPTDSTKLLQWKVKDARVMSWILGSVDPLIVLNLRLYKTVKTMWEYLKKVYYQDNNARRFQLENDISNYSQYNLSIQDYYSVFQNLWAEYTNIIYAKIPAESLSVVQQVHEQSKRDQFLMKLRYEFEITRSNLINELFPPWMFVLGNYCSKSSVTRPKELMSSPKCRSVEVINNPARPGSNHRKVNYINYK